ncbi:MAG: 2Fe-2S iron-sulfur cluster binding domain-containing protein [Azospirillaceae bacterium]
MSDLATEVGDRAFDVTIEGEDGGAGDTVRVAPGDTLLGALLRAGRGIAYECTAGGCGSCKVTLLDGTVDPGDEGAPGLRPADRRRGKVLACLSRPRDDCRIAVKIDPAYVPRIRPWARRARLVERAALTPDLHEFTFAADGPADFLPGQFARLFLPGLDAPRCYSMSNIANGDGTWRFIVKRVPGGAATGRLFADDAVGLEVALDAPYSIAHLGDPAPRPVTCVAGGSGLAPMISILHGLAARGRGLAKARLFYGARTAAEVVRAERLAEIPGFDADRQYVPVVSEPAAGDGWSGAVGLVGDRLGEAAGADAAARDYFIAGPPPMVDAVRRLLVLDRKVPVDQLHYDRFY